MHQTHRVIWADGMLMSPQHFQQQDAFHEAAREARLRSIAPDAWGVSRVRLDDASLNDNRVWVRTLSVTFPSGAHIAFDSDTSEAAATARPLARPLEQAFLPAAKHLAVYVGLAHVHPGAANVAVDGAAGVHHRYAAQKRTVAEQTHAQTPAVEVAFAVPHVQLVFEGEPSAHLELVQIGELACDAHGRLIWVEDYLAPCLHIGASAHLMMGLQSRHGRLMARQRHLAGLCQHRRGAEHALHIGELMPFMHLAAVRAALPWLEALATGSTLAPGAAYLMLKQLIGQLSVLSAQTEVPALPALQHTDLRSGFAFGLQALDAMLAAGDDGTHQSVPMVLQDDGMYTASFAPGQLVDDARWLLTVEGPDLDAAQTDSWGKWALLSAPTEMPNRIRAAVLGAHLTRLARPPSHVPWRPDVAYFEIDTTDAAWQGIIDESALAVRPPPGQEDRPWRLELLVLGRATP